MNDTALKESILGEQQDSLGWKIYGWFPFVLILFAIWALLASIGTKSREDAFLGADTTTVAEGQVIDVDVNWATRNPRNMHLGDLEIVRVDGAIITRLSKSGRRFNNRDEQSELVFTPTISFIAADGDPYTFRGGSSRRSPSYAPGDSVSVLYDRSNPTIAKLSQQAHSGSTVLRILGMVGVALGLVLWFLNQKRKETRQKLFNSGVGVEAVVRDVYYDKHFKPGEGQVRPIRLVANWSDKKRVQSHEFTSEMIFAEYDDNLISKKVSVVMIPNDPKTYQMDTAFLDFRKAA